MQPEKIPNENIKPEILQKDWSYVIDHLIETGQLPPQSTERRKLLVDYFIAQAAVGNDIRVIIENQNTTQIHDTLSAIDFVDSQLLKS